MRNLDLSCRGLAPAYLKFVDQMEREELGGSGIAGNTILDDILKYETLMK